MNTISRAALASVGTFGLALTAVMVSEIDLKASPLSTSVPAQIQHNSDQVRIERSYEFTHSGVRRIFSCTIDHGLHEREDKSLGYTKAQLEKELYSKLRGQIQGEADRRGISLQSIEIWGEVRFEFCCGTPKEKRYLERWGSRAAAELDRLFLKSHGLTQKHVPPIDYEGVVQRATPVLAECFQEFKKAMAIGKDDIEALRPALLAFFQEMVYEKPPQTESGREIYEFWVPTRVMVEKKGDCDSKAASFCAMWGHLKQPALLIIIPGHALVAVPGDPAQSDLPPLENRYYVLYEVSGKRDSPLRLDRESLDTATKVLIEPYQPLGAAR